MLNLVYGFVVNKEFLSSLSVEKIEGVFLFSETACDEVSNDKVFIFDLDEFLVIGFHFKKFDKDYALLDKALSEEMNEFVKNIDFNKLNRILEYLLKMYEDTKDERFRLDEKLALNFYLINKGCL